MDKNRQRLLRRVLGIGAAWVFCVALSIAGAKTNSVPGGARSPLIPLPAPALTNRTYSVSLAWERSPDSSVVGYKIYWGPDAGFYTNSASVGNTTNCVITNLGRSQYFFNATAYNSAGMESKFAGEIAADIPYNPPFTNYVLFDWVRLSGTNRTLVSRYVLTNPPGDSGTFEALVVQTNDQVRVVKMGKIISITNTNQ